MTLDEAKKIVEEERLGPWVIWPDEKRKEYATWICKEGDKWLVCDCTERATVSSATMKYFDEFEAALDMFIKYARLTKWSFVWNWERINHRPYPNK